MKYVTHVGLDQPARYAVKAQGRLAVEGRGGVADWFQGKFSFTYEYGADGEAVTVITGVIADQAALHGLLSYIRDLGLTLLMVDCITARAGEDAQRE